MIRVRFGERGGDTTCADLAREMGVNRVRPWSWEVEGCWPGRSRLATFLGLLRRVREEGVDPVALAEWVEQGPDDAPPWKPVNLDDARDPRRTEIAAAIAPAQPTTSPPPVDALALLERALEIAEKGNDPAPLLRFGIDTLRRARQLGLAAIAPIAFTLHVGASPASTPPGFEPGRRGSKRRPLRVLRGSPRRAQEVALDRSA